MNFKQFWILMLGVFITFSACKSDDDGNDQLPQEQQNEVDDEAIVLYLKKHKFNSVGKVVEIEALSDEEDTPLYSLAQQVDGGYWYVKRPDYVANGRSVVNKENDSILIQYELKTFYGKLNTQKDSVYYTTPSRYTSTINTTGIPIGDPDFYHVNLNEAQKDAGYQKNWYEMEGIVDGLTHFNSTEREEDALPAVDFQGVIVVPSRLVFGRDRNAFNFINDTSVILNFELYKVDDRVVTE